MARHFNYGHPHWWQWLTVLSLDAPLVAVLWQWMFAQVLGIRLPWHDPVLLGLGVWLIYAADRWIEGWRLSADIVKTPRHFFYMRYRWPVFGIAMLILLLIMVIAVYRLERAELVGGFILLVPTSFYLLSHQFLHRNHPLRLPKEICIAVIFALGCALAPAIHAQGQLTLLYVPTVLLGLLCFCNCALIGLWEMEVDASHGQTSLARQLKAAAHFIHALPWLCALAAVTTHIVGPAALGSITLCAAVSGALMGLVDILVPHIGRLPARAVVDITLMTPAWLLLIK